MILSIFLAFYLYIDMGKIKDKSQELVNNAIPHVLSAQQGAINLVHLKRNVEMMTASLDLQMARKAYVNTHILVSESVFAKSDYLQQKGSVILHDVNRLWKLRLQLDELRATVNSSLNYMDALMYLIYNEQPMLFPELDTHVNNYTDLYKQTGNIRDLKGQHEFYYRLMLERLGEDFDRAGFLKEQFKLRQARQKQDENKSGGKSTSLNVSNPSFSDNASFAAIASTASEGIGGTAAKSASNIAASVKADALGKEQSVLADVQSNNADLMEGEELNPSDPIDASLESHLNTLDGHNIFVGHNEFKVTNNQNASNIGDLDESVVIDIEHIQERHNGPIFFKSREHDLKLLSLYKSELDRFNTLWALFTKLQTVFSYDTNNLSNEIDALSHSFTSGETAILHGELSDISQLAAQIKPMVMLTVGFSLVGFWIVIFLLNRFIIKPLKNIARILIVFRRTKRVNIQQNASFFAQDHVMEIREIIDILPQLFDEFSNIEKKSSDLDLRYKKLLESSKYDALTKVLNRGTLNLLIKSIGANTPANFAVLMVDIDYFKNLNDTMGHQRGDEVLFAVAQTLQGNLAKKDFVFRYGGEEFCVVLSEISPSNAYKVAERLCTTIRKLALINNGVPSGLVTVSIGISLVTKSNSQFRVDELISQADKALYLAKRNGRNQVVACPKAMVFGMNEDDGTSGHDNNDEAAEASPDADSSNTTTEEASKDNMAPLDALATITQVEHKKRHSPQLTSNKTSVDNSEQSAAESADSKALDQKIAADKTEASLEGTKDNLDSTNANSHGADANLDASDADNGAGADSSSSAGAALGSQDKSGVEGALDASSSDSTSKSTSGKDETYTKSVSSVSNSHVIEVAHVDGLTNSNTSAQDSSIESAVESSSVEAATSDISLDSRSVDSSSVDSKSLSDASPAMQDEAASREGADQDLQQNAADKTQDNQLSNVELNDSVNNDILSVLRGSMDDDHKKNHFIHPVEDKERLEYERQIEAEFEAEEKALKQEQERKVHQVEHDPCMLFNLDGFDFYAERHNARQLEAEKHAKENKHEGKGTKHGLHFSFFHHSDSKDESKEQAKTSNEQTQTISEQALVHSDKAESQESSLDVARNKAQSAALNETSTSEQNSNVLVEQESSLSVSESGVVSVTEGANTNSTNANSSSSVSNTSNLSGSSNDQDEVKVVQVSDDTCEIEILHQDSSASKQQQDAHSTEHLDNSQPKLPAVYQNNANRNVDPKVADNVNHKVTDNGASHGASQEQSDTQHQEYELVITRDEAGNSHEYFIGEQEGPIDLTEANAAQNKSNTTNQGLLKYQSASLKQDKDHKSDIDGPHPCIMTTKDFPDVDTRNKSNTGNPSENLILPQSNELSQVVIDRNLLAVMAAANPERGLTEDPLTSDRSIIDIRTAPNVLPCLISVDMFFPDNYVPEYDAEVISRDPEHQSQGFIDARLKVDCAGSPFMLKEDPKDRSRSEDEIARWSLASLFNRYKSKITKLFKSRSEPAQEDKDDAKQYDEHKDQSYALTEHDSDAVKQSQNADVHPDLQEESTSSQDEQSKSVISQSVAETLDKALEQDVEQSMAQHAQQLSKSAIELDDEKADDGLDEAEPETKNSVEKTMHDIVSTPNYELVSKIEQNNRKEQAQAQNNVPEQDADTELKDSKQQDKAQDQNPSKG